MCTLIILNECIPDYPLVVAANRDERYDRKSSPPEARTLPGLNLICPTDDVRGGTWIGVADGGWFVGITNQDDGHHDDNKLSRGQLVRRMLTTPVHCEAAKVLAHVDPDHYNPFNLVFGRPGAMFLSRVLPGQAVTMDPLEPGVHAISNDCWGDRYKEKTEWARGMAWSLTMDPYVGDIETTMQRLMVTLASHFSHRHAKDDPFQSVCVHADEHCFGTVSSSLITVSNQGLVEYWFKEGPACQHTRLTLAGRLLPDSHE